LALFLLVGVVSADTLIFQIGASGNDGYVSETTDSNWQTITDAAGDDFATALGTSYDEVRLTATTNAGEYAENRKGVFLFNTSTVPDGDVIDSVDFAIYGEGKAAQLGAFDLEVVGISYVSGAGIAATLYNNKNTNRLAPNITYASYNTGGWNNFTFNSDGLNYINKTAVTSLMLMNSIDYINNSAGLTWLGGNKSAYLWRDRSVAITTNIPTLTIVYHTLDTTPPASITGLTNTTFNCGNISWQWTNPIGADFNHTYVLKNNVWIANYTNTTTTALWTGLSNITAYTFSSKTVDITGNMNATWVNATATTAECPVVTPPTPTPTPTSTPIPTPSTEPWCGRQTIYFNHINSTDPTSYERLLNYPDGGAEIQENITLKDTMGEVLIDSYISDPGYPNTDLLIGGLSRFRTYHYVSSTPGITTVNFSVSKRSITGNQTFLWSVESQDINNLNINEILTSHVTNVSYALAATDRILINVSGKTTHSSNIYLNWFYQGTNHASHVELEYFNCEEEVCGCGTTAPPTAAPWQPLINPSTDTKFDFRGWITEWWWLPVLILIMILLLGRK
jgi:hypothetical protein